MKKLWIIAFTCIAVLTVNMSAADEETSTLNNEAQVQKAENLSVASQEEAQKTAQADVSTAQENFNSAKDAYAQDATPENLAAMNDAQANLDKVTEDLSNVSGVSQEDIDGMRASGMGWGEIAHELGVHPSVLGLGHTKDKARERNSKSFSDDTSDVSNQGGKGLGLSGKSQSSGKSDTAGNNSNSGKGNSEGKGSDKK
jgi:uncharacterized membrane protein YdfJ with MMPL/SSD domain